MTQNRPLLTIGMIVKNEIRCIERCLKALEPLRKAIPCELIIADTGSEDGTREVIERYADVVFDFPWINDFAAARNAVMDRCLGQWYLTVDADEYLDEDIHELTAFLTGEIQQHWVAAGVIQRNYKSKEMNCQNGNDFLALRMLRMDTGIRYTGIIHEFWDLHGKKAYALKHTVLHHDGYAAISPKFVKEKAERNMALLRTELEKDPENIRTLLQCIESSSIFPHEQMSYMLKGMSLLMEGKITSKHQYAAPLCRFGVCSALNDKLPQAEVWLKWAEEHISSSIFFRLDIAAAAIIYFRNKEQYDVALSWGERYLEGIADYESQNFDFTELSSSTLICRSPSNELQCREAISDCFVVFGRNIEAMVCLEQVDPCVGKPNLSSNYLLLLVRLAQCSETKKRAKELCAEFFQRLLKEQGIEAERCVICIKVLIQEFEDTERRGWQLFQLIPGDIGLAAKMMDETIPDVLTALLGQVKDWNSIPAAAVLHAIQYHAHFPETFYKRSYQEQQKMISALSRAGISPVYFVDWVERENMDSLFRLQLFTNLCAAIVARMDTGKIQDSDFKIYVLLQSLLAAYIPRLYSPNLLHCQEEWTVLPELHKFGLLLIKAQELQETGNELGCIRTLKDALEVAPSMKNMVTFLVQQLERKKQESASPELLELANKVRTILTQYLPDDPAVIALKQSEVYQKVAYLIEGMEASAFGGLSQ